jgi:hypothetical protein
MHMRNSYEIPLPRNLQEPNRVRGLGHKLSGRSQAARRSYGKPTKPVGTGFICLKALRYRPYRLPALAVIMRHFELLIVTIYKSY